MTVSNRHSKIDDMTLAALAKIRLPIAKQHRSAAHVLLLLGHAVEQMTLGLGSQ